MSGRLTGRTALLTGAGGGIGKAVAEAYLDEGAQCVLSDLREPTPTTRTLLERYPDAATWVSADITDLAQIDALVEQTLGRLDHIDILFNNAGIFDMAPLLDSDEAMYDRLFSVNVKGMFFTMQAVARGMVAAGAGGKIINIASQAGRRGEALVSHYCATKAAVISYTQSAALALAPHNIQVNGIAPGVIDTPMWDTVDGLFARYENKPKGQKKREVGEAVPLGRMGQPQDLAGAAVFLASADSDYVTAQTLNVDGGNWMS